MDFVARAGSVVDRAHRTAGVLLILVIILTAVVLTQWMKNAELNRQITLFAQRMPVYVVPGATRGIYSPTEDDLLIRAFVDQITQSFNTFTYENIQNQYQEMKSFFTPEMLTFSQDYFEKLISDSRADRRASLFIPDHQTLKVEKTMENGVETRNVTLRGSLQTILAGSVVESVPVEMALKLRKVVISKTNPFGFQLAAYQARRLSTNSNDAAGAAQGRN